MPQFQNRDIISIQDFSKEDFLYILKKAKGFKEKPRPDLLTSKVLANLFYEPSTRTRLSFDAAMQKLGGRVIGFADPRTSSLEKGETLADTIKIVENYADVIAIRHPEVGSAQLAADQTDKPVINAGDGPNQHPTQTLLDLFAIQETQGTLENLNVAMSGDLKYGRTVHSLVPALSYFGVKLFFISPDSLKMPEEIKDELKTQSLEFSEHREFSEVMDQIDILYVTRIQKERFPSREEYEKVKDLYILKVSDLEGAKDNLKILHPLPRVNEIDYQVDKTPYAYYFQQAGDGLFIRQALLALILGAIK